MSSNVQSIVCCLGDPVAGNPTQFLMQRAAASQSLDWMFVTAEVAHDKIEEAFQGIRALRFSGVAFLPPHQSAGCKLVDSMTEAALRSGNVRVARRDGDLWLGDDTLGAAVVQLLVTSTASSVGPSPSPVESGLILVSGRPWLAHLMRLALPNEWNGRLRELVSRTTETRSPTLANSTLASSGAIETDLSTTLERSASVVQVSFEAAESLGLPIDALVLDSTASCPSSKVLAKFPWSANPTIVLVESNQRFESSLAGLRRPNLRILRSIDVVSAKAVVNFHFWTGHHTDLAFVRESLDEYCQW